MAAKEAASSGEKETIQRMTVYLPRSLYQDLKLLSAAEDVTLNDLIIRGARLALKEKEAGLRRYIEAWLAVNREPAQVEFLIPCQPSEMKIKRNDE